MVYPFYAHAHGPARAALAAEAFDDFGDSLHGATATGMALEIIALRVQWNTLRWAGELARSPLLVIGASKAEGGQNRKLADAVAAAGGKVTAIIVTMDHAFQDHRIALAGQVVDWLRKHPGPIS